MPHKEYLFKIHAIDKYERTGAKLSHDLDQRRELEVISKHVHHFKIWKKLLNTLPATAENIEYGTPEMANEIARLFNEQKLSHHKIFAMAGHNEGIVCFGKILPQAAELLLNELGDVTN